jgi:hypothetical protein
MVNSLRIARVSRLFRSSDDGTAWLLRGPEDGECDRAGRYVVALQAHPVTTGIAGRDTSAVGKQAMKGHDARRRWELVDSGG